MSPAVKDSADIGVESLALVVSPLTGLEAPVLIYSSLAIVYCIEFVITKFRVKN